MHHAMNPFLRWLAGVFAVAAIVTPASAQTRTGSLFLEVLGQQGDALVGVGVSLAGGDFTRETTTDAQGRARFTGLVPGVYDLALKNQDFETRVLQGIQIDAGASPSFQIELRVADVDHPVVTSARTPVLNRREPGASTVFTRPEIEEVPTARDPWSIISTIPGVTTDRVNVAGSEAGDQAKFVGKGVDWSQSTWNMDGAEFTDLANLGFSSTFVDYNALEQIRFATSGADIESQTAGVQLEFVTKQGVNRWAGTARFVYAEQGMQDENNGGLTQPPWVANRSISSNVVDEIFEKHFDIGGPLVKDNLWSWFGFTQNDVAVRLISGQPDTTKLRNISGKIHGQLLGKGTYKGFYTVGDKIKSGLGGGITRPPETTWNESGPSPIYGAGVSYFFTPDLEATFQVSKVDGGFQFRPLGDFNQQIFQDAGGVFRRTFSAYRTDRPVDQFLAKGNWFFDTGSWDHELKFGFRYKTATVDSLSKYGAFDLIASKYYTPNYVTLYRELNTSVDTEYANAWVGDTVLEGPWTLTGGLHFSRQSGEQNPSTAGPNGLAPSLIQGLSFPGFDPGFEWSDVSPRVGVSYTFDSEKRLMLRANYGRYVDQLGSGIVRYNLPLTYVAVQYEWNDDDQDDIVDWDDATNTGELVDLDGSGTVDCGDSIFSFNIDPCDTDSATSDFKIDPELDAPQVDEWIVGAELEVLEDFTIGVTSTWRIRDRMVWTPFYNYEAFLDDGRLDTLSGLDVYECDEIVSDADAPFNPSGRTFVEPYCLLRDPDDPRIPPGRARWETNMPGYEQRYGGVEITGTKRLSKGWMARAFLSYDRWQNRFDGVPLTPGIYGAGAGLQSGDPTNLRGGTAADGGLVAVQSLQSIESGAKQDVFIGSSRWQFNLNGLYQLPRGWSVSGNLYGRQGYGLADFVTVLTPTGEGLKSVQLDHIDTNRYDDLWLLDLRLAKRFVVGGNSNVEVAVEAFNATNENTPLQLGQRVNSTTYRRIGEIASPRILRLAATVDF